MASPGDCPASAFATAGVLAGFSNFGSMAGDRDLDPPFGTAQDIYLHEVSDPKWSARSYLDSALYRKCEDKGSGEYLRPGLGSGGSWQLLNEVDSRERPSHSPRRKIHVHHLGQMTGALLEWADTLGSLDPIPSDRKGVRTGLVWCIQDREAGSLCQAQTLGRLLAVLNPDCLEILLFPGLWSEKTLPGWLGRIQNAARGGVTSTRPDVVEIGKLVGCLQPRIEANVTLLDTAGDGKMAAVCSPGMLDVARRLTAS
ncbi:MAG: hypothetical protein KOO60_13695 [Gemmatimonadales bacterium]|nr:hypothetical protein [Gemmatimonadales bacterium]